MVGKSNAKLNWLRRKKTLSLWEDICLFYAILPLNIHYTTPISVRYLIKTDAEQKNIFCPRVDVEQNKFISKKEYWQMKNYLVATNGLFSYQSTEHLNSKSQYEKREYVVPTNRIYLSAIF